MRPTALIFQRFAMTDHLGGQVCVIIGFPETVRLPAGGVKGHLLKLVQT